MRRIWRLHFWVGLFVAPALIVLACTGLIILYTQPLDLWLHSDLKVVTPTTSTVSLDDQVATAGEQVGPDMVFDAVTPPQDAEASTQVDFLPAEESGIGERNVTQVFIDPYTGQYLGQRQELDGLVGWANQLHRFFGNDGPTVSLPAFGHFIAPSAYPDREGQTAAGDTVAQGWPHPVAGSARNHRNPAVGGADLLYRFRSDLVALLGRELAGRGLDRDAIHRNRCTVNSGQGR